MAAEIEKVVEIIEEGLSVSPGKMTELKTPYGAIQIIGTERGFAVRRPGATGPDIRYSNGDSLTIDMKNGTKLKITGRSPQDWQASEMLDPMA